MSLLLLSRYGAIVLTSGDQTKQRALSRKKVSHKHRKGNLIYKRLSSSWVLVTRKGRIVLSCWIPLSKQERNGKNWLSYHLWLEVHEAAKVEMPSIQTRDDARFTRTLGNFVLFAPGTKNSSAAAALLLASMRFHHPWRTKPFVCTLLLQPVEWSSFILSSLLVVPSLLTISYLFHSFD